MYFTQYNFTRVGQHVQLNYVQNNFVQKNDFYRVANANEYFPIIVGDILYFGGLMGLSDIQQKDLCRF